MTFLLVVASVLGPLVFFQSTSRATGQVVDVVARNGQCKYVGACTMYAATVVYTIDGKTHRARNELEPVPGYDRPLSAAGRHVGETVHLRTMPNDPERVVFLGWGTLCSYLVWPAIPLGVFLMGWVNRKLTASSDEPFDPSQA